MNESLNLSLNEIRDLLLLILMNEKKNKNKKVARIFFFRFIDRKHLLQPMTMKKYTKNHPETVKLLTSLGYLFIAILFL